MSDAAVRRLLLATVIATLLLGGGTAYWWYDRQSGIGTDALDALNRSLSDTSTDLQNRLTADIDARQLAAEKERAESETGVGLYTLCTTWAEFHSNHPSDDTLENRDRACGDYRRYISTGELPPDRDNADTS